MAFGSESGGACELRELQDAADVPIWSKISEMCSLQFCDISWSEFKFHFYLIIDI